MKQLREPASIQGPRLDSRVAHTKNRTARVKEVWDQQLSRWLEWRLAQETRACAGVAHLPLQQGTRHSILTALGQALPERVLRDFGRHRDTAVARALLARATRVRSGALPRATGPYLVPGATSPEDAKANSTDVPRE